MHISELTIYPLKSARQQRVQALPLGAMGPEWDRRWMLVDSAGQFVSQRTHPRLSLLDASVNHGVLTLSAEGHEDLRVEPDAVPSVLPVVVWRDGVQAEAVSAVADAWCSAFLGAAVRLVFMAEHCVRTVDEHYAGEGHRTAFSDGFPLLLVTQSSLDFLNQQLDVAVDWRRFRPNIVVAGDLPPHAEDGWRRLRIGDIELALVKPCSRCVIPSIDPDTARKNRQILTVLQRYRRRDDGKIYWGQNSIVSAAPSTAVLRVGDAVELLA